MPRSPFACSIQKYFYIAFKNLHNKLTISLIARKLDTIVEQQGFQVDKTKRFLSKHPTEDSFDTTLPK